MPNHPGGILAQMSRRIFLYTLAVFHCVMLGLAGALGAPDGTTEPFEVQPKPDLHLPVRVSLLKWGTDIEVASAESDGARRLWLTPPGEGTYLVRAVFRSRWFEYTYVGDRQVTRFFDNTPVEVLPRDQRPRPVLILLLGAAIFGALATIQLLRRRTQILQNENRQLIMPMVSDDATAPTLEGQPPLVGKILQTEGGDLLEIVRTLGQGGMGVVYEAACRTPERDGERWAIKVPYHSAMQEVETRRRFVREAQICIKLRHPALVKVVDWGTYRTEGGEEDAEWPFIVMELVEGQDLRQKLEPGAPVPLVQAVDWMTQTVRAMKAVHGAGIVHRDLKPENMIITHAGAVKVTDFGIASSARHSLTGTGVALGTPLYMSPEHLEARGTTPASDVYSLGVIFYEMLAGRPPFLEENAFSLLTLMLTETPPRLSSLKADVPDELERLVEEMMSLDARSRPSEDEILGRLAAFSDDQRTPTVSP